MRRTGWIASLCAALVLLAACGAEETPAVEATEPVEQTVLLAGKTFVLDGYNGSVTVVGRNDSTATVSLEKRARAETEEAAQELLGAISAEMEETEEAFTVELSSEAPERTSVDVRAEVPYKTPLRLTFDNGELEIKAVSAPIVVSVTNGDILIEGATGNLDVEVVNGRLTTKMAGFREGAEVSLQTTNGVIDLTVPPSASAQVEASTQVGGIELKGITLKERTDEGHITGGDVAGVLGDGAGRIRLKTQAGAIVLRGAQ